MAVPLHEVAGVMQYIVFAVAAALALFFLVHVRWKQGNWEVLFANLALATLYMMQRQWGVNGPATINSANSGRPLPWLRYGEWLLTFPPLLAAVADLTGVGRRKWGRGMALLGAFLVALFMGVTAAYSSGTAPKVAFACIAASAFAGVLVLTSLTLSVTYHEVPLFLRDFVSLLRYVLLLTWLAYPVIWALGPEGFHRISSDGATVAFAFADLFGKCAWSLLLWYFRHTVRTSVPAHFWDVQGQPQGIPADFEGSATAYELFTKGDLAFAPKRRFQPALPDGQSPQQVSHTLYEAPVPSFPEEDPMDVPLIGWPLGLTGARALFAARRNSKEGPRFWFPGLFDQIRTEQAAYSPGGTPFPATKPALLDPRSRQEIRSEEGVVFYGNPLAVLSEGAVVTEHEETSGHGFARGLPEGFPEGLPAEGLREGLPAESAEGLPEGSRASFEEELGALSESQVATAKAFFERKERAGALQDRVTEKKAVVNQGPLFGPTAEENTRGRIEGPDQEEGALSGRSAGKNIRARSNEGSDVVARVLQEKAAQAAEARARACELVIARELALKRELAIDIPSDAPGEKLWSFKQSGRTPGADVRSEPPKRSWGAFLLPFLGRKEPPRAETEEDGTQTQEPVQETGYKTLTRAPTSGIYASEENPQLPLTPVPLTPVLLRPVETPRSILEGPLERITEGPEGSGVDSSAMARQFKVPASMTSSVEMVAASMTSSVAMVENSGPRPTPRRRPLPFVGGWTEGGGLAHEDELGYQDGYENQGGFTNQSGFENRARLSNPGGFMSKGGFRFERKSDGEEPVPDVLESSPLGERRFSRKKSTQEDEDDIDSFDSVGSEIVESSSSGLEGDEGPQFRIFSGRRNSGLTKPDAGSPLPDETVPLGGGNEMLTRQLSWPDPGLSSPARVRAARALEGEGLLDSASSKGFPKSSAAAGFDEKGSPQSGFVWARPATRQSKEEGAPLSIVTTSPGLRKSLSSERLGGLSPSPTRGRRPRSPVRRSVLMERSAGDVDGGGVSVSFDPPVRRGGGSFRYWSVERKEQEAEAESSGEGSEQEKESSEYWGNPTSTVIDPPSGRSTDAETLRTTEPNSEETVEKEVLDEPRTAQERAHAHGSDAQQERARAFEWARRPIRLQGPRAVDPPAPSRRSYDSGLVWKMMDDLEVDMRRRSFPAPQPRGLRSATDSLRRLFPANPVSARARPLDGYEDAPPRASVERDLDERIPAPAAEAWEDDEASGEAPGRSVEIGGSMEERIPGLGEEDGVRTDRRVRRPSPYYYYGGEPVSPQTFAPVITPRARSLTPIREAWSPERMSLENGERPRTPPGANRFYSPNFRRT